MDLAYDASSGLLKRPVALQLLALILNPDQYILLAPTRCFLYCHEVPQPYRLAYFRTSFHGAFSRSAWKWQGF